MVWLTTNKVCSCIRHLSKLSALASIALKNVVEEDWEHAETALNDAERSYQELERCLEKGLPALRAELEDAKSYVTRRLKNLAIHNLITIIYLAPIEACDD